MSRRSKGYLCSVRSKSRVGPHYQAVVPVFVPGDDDVTTDVEDKLLWNPARIEEGALERYLSAIRSMKHRFGEEKVLYLLHQCAYNAEEALRRFRLMPDDSCVTTTWSQEECRRFEEGLDRHGKEFGLIQKLIRSRSVEDVVEFYYMWKKTERYDIFVNEKNVYGKSKFRSKARKKVYRTTEHAEAMIEEEQLSEESRLLYSMPVCLNWME